MSNIDSNNYINLISLPISVEMQNNIYSYSYAYLSKSDITTSKVIENANEFQLRY